MIFWYSGTGNSWHVASHVQKRFGGEMISMAEAVRESKYTYAFAENEEAVFVFPVYYGGLPGTVKTFLRNFRVEGTEPPIVGICTYATACQAVDQIFAGLLRAGGRKVRAFYDIKMPQNCIFLFSAPIREAALMQLKRSDARLKDVLDSMQFNHRMPFRSTGAQGISGRMFYTLYAVSQRTSGFRVTDRCTGCGICAANCPVQAIEMKDGRPVWVKKRCDKCAGCINRCPARAIEFGALTKKRNRYAHPDWEIARPKVLEQGEDPSWRRKR